MADLYLREQRVQDEEQFVCTLLEHRVASFHRHLKYCEVNHFGFGIRLERFSESVFYWIIVTSIPILTWQHRSLNLFQVHCCQLSIHEHCKCRRRRNVTPALFFVRKYRCYVKHCRCRLAICKLFVKNRASDWEEAKIVCIVAAETSEKSYITDRVIYFVGHHAGD